MAVVWYCYGELCEDLMVSFQSISFTNNKVSGTISTLIGNLERLEGKWMSQLCWSPCSILLAIAYHLCVGASNL